MIVSGYDLQLYCDNYKELDDEIHEYGEFPHDFPGGTRNRSYKNARKAGWRINDKRNRATCPKCKTKESK